MIDQGKDFQVKIQCDSDKEAEAILIDKKLREISNANVLVKSIEIVENTIIIVFKVLS